MKKIHKKVIQNNFYDNCIFQKSLSTIFKGLASPDFLFSYIYKWEEGCLMRAHFANTHSQGFFKWFFQGLYKYVSIWC